MPNIVVSNIFISFSGDRSRAVGIALSTFLPRVIGAARPWISETIEKGTTWPAEIQKALHEVAAGIIVITPENVNERWIHYEAGALSNGISDSPRRVYPYVVGMGKGSIGLPLSIFQATDANVVDTLLMVKGIRNAVSPELPDLTLEFAFQNAFPHLKAVIEKSAPTKNVVKEKPPAIEDMFNEIMTMLRRAGQSRDRRPTQQSPDAMMSRHALIRSIINDAFKAANVEGSAGVVERNGDVLRVGVHGSRADLGVANEDAMIKLLRFVEGECIWLSYNDVEVYISDEGISSTARVVA